MQIYDFFLIYHLFSRRDILKPLRQRLNYTIIKLKTECSIFIV